NFMSTWGRRTTRDLFDYMSATMPPGGSTLSADDYAAIVAFVLQSNGATSGAQAFSPATEVAIASIATGRAPEVAQAAPAAGGRGQGAGARGQGPGGAGRGPAQGGRGRGDGDDADAGGGGGRGFGRGAAPPRGLTIAGEVKNFTPVTDAMLRNPDPGDWLMIRRNYQAWSYSPLSEVTNRNVQDLRLAWVWAMNDGGASQPTPMVHNGIIYLANTSNVVQALDGRTGDLIWENSIGPEATRAYGATRSLAIYQDKVFIAATDAKLYAL